jgi:hypothetical protein
MTQVGDALAVRLREEVRTLREQVELGEPLVLTGPTLEPEHAFGPIAVQPSRTIGEALDELEQRADELARDEALVLERCASFFVAESERDQALRRAAETWPWSRTHGRSSKPLAALWWAVRDLACYRSGATSEGARAKQLELWPSDINGRDVVEWVAQGLDCQGRNEVVYRAWCEGRATWDLSDEALQELDELAERAGLSIKHARSVNSATVLGERVGFPDTIGITAERPLGMVGLHSGATIYGNELALLEARHRAETEDVMLVRGEQLGSLFAALPAVVRGASAVLGSMRAMARGDAHRYFLETIAPLAVKLESEEALQSYVAEHASNATVLGNVSEHTRRRLGGLLDRVNAKPEVRATGEATELAKRFDRELELLLSRLGARSRKLRDAIRAGLRARGEARPWSLWQLNEAGRYEALVTLARALLMDEVLPELERQKRNTEALVMPIQETVTKLHSRSGKPRAGQRELEFEDGSTISFDHPLMDSESLDMLRKGMTLLGSVDAHRLLRWEVVSGYRNWIEGRQSPHVLELQRGYGELAEKLGIRDKGAPQRLRAILTAQRSCVFPLPGPGKATGNLIVLSEWAGSGRHAGRVRIELGSMLMPVFVHELGEHNNGRTLAQMQRLVPLIALPPFVGNERAHGPQATLSMLVTREMRVRAGELYREGGVHIDLPTWARLAAEAQLPRSSLSQYLEPILTRWTRDATEAEALAGDASPAFLRIVDRDRYKLGANYESAHRFLVEAGEREVAGSQGGKASAKNRAAKLTRKPGTK